MVGLYLLAICVTCMVAAEVSSVASPISKWAARIAAVAYLGMLCEFVIVPFVNYLLQ